MWVGNKIIELFVIHMGIVGKVQSVSQKDLHSKEEFQRFVGICNGHEERIKVTYDICKEEAVFLDVEVVKGEKGKVERKGKNGEDREKGEEEVKKETMGKKGKEVDGVRKRGRGRGTAKKKGKVEKGREGEDVGRENGKDVIGKGQKGEGGKVVLEK